MTRLRVFLLVSVEDDVRVTVVKFSVVFFGPVSHLLYIYILAMTMNRVIKLCALHSASFHVNSGVFILYYILYFIL